MFLIFRFVFDLFIRMNKEKPNNYYKYIELYMKKLIDKMLILK